MKNDEFENSLPIIGMALAGTISVTTSSGKFDLTDTIVGIILLMVLLPYLIQPKSTYIRWLSSLVAGLCALLIAGFGVEVLGESYCSNSKYQILHFAFWLIASFISLGIITIFEKKHNKAKH